MLICGIDFETTGLDPQKDRVIEIGAILWDTKTQNPVQILSALIDQDLVIPDEIVILTGITTEDIRSYGISEKAAFEALFLMVSRAEYLVAHNAPFDKGFYDVAVAKFAEPGKDFWIDTAADIAYPPSITTRSLKHLAAEHKFVNPFSHRAVFDVMTMLVILDRYPIEEVVARSKEVTLCVQACVSFDEKEKAKEKGFRWAPKSKAWWKNYKESDYLKDRESCGFRTVVLQKVPE